MFRRSQNVLRRRLLIVCILITCLSSFSHFLLIPSLNDEQTNQHQYSLYNLSDTLLMTNIIDQFLDSKDEEERERLWSLLVQSWSKSFELYLQRTQAVCSLPSSSANFVQHYLIQYTNKLLLTNINLQRSLTGFGLFFDYDPKIMRSESHRIFPNTFSSPCLYFELIILVMKVQFVLYELNINYFIGQNTLIGSLRHHDIVPWHSRVELNLPLSSKNKVIENISNKFQLQLQQVGLTYEISIENQTWPQVEIYFYQENSNELFDAYNDQSTMKIGRLRRNDVYPFHLRPFGPILLSSIHRPQVMISQAKLNICESLPRNHQLGKQTAIDHLRRIPCEQLHTVYSFVHSNFSRRRSYCEETLQTKHLPFRTLSYVRYTCPENIGH